MSEFRMICSQIADFGPEKGIMFRILRNQVGKPVTAPEWIKKTLMYKWLYSEGAIQILPDEEPQETDENAVSSPAPVQTDKESAEEAEAVTDPVEVKTEVSAEGKRPYTRRKK